VVLDSVLERDKKELLSFHDEMRTMVKSGIMKNNLPSSGLKSLIDTFLVSWNESIDVDTETFWSLLEKEKIVYIRKEPLRRALAKGRFRNVHEGMEACKNFNKLIDSGLLKSRYSEDELIALKQIINNDTASRVELLTTCLKSGKIPFSKYLRFGDSMAYMENCNLLKSHFSEEEVDQLLDVWRNFK
jgi:hypothetical protein